MRLCVETFDCCDQWDEGVGYLYSAAKYDIDDEEFFYRLTLIISCQS